MAEECPILADSHTDTLFLRWLPSLRLCRAKFANMVKATE